MTLCRNLLWGKLLVFQKDSEEMVAPMQRGLSLLEFPDGLWLGERPPARWAHGRLSLGPGRGQTALTLRALSPLILPNRQGTQPRGVAVIQWHQFPFLTFRPCFHRDQIKVPLHAALGDMVGGSTQRANRSPWGEAGQSFSGMA